MAMFDENPLTVRFFHTGQFKLPCN